MNFKIFCLAIFTVINLFGSIKNEAGIPIKEFTVRGRFSGYLYTCTKDYAIRTLKRDFDTLVYQAEEREGCLGPSNPIADFRCVGSCPGIDYGVAECRRSYKCRVAQTEEAIDCDLEVRAFGTTMAVCNFLHSGCECARTEFPRFKAKNPSCVEKGSEACMRFCDSKARCS